jgi:hypothetical protein
MAKIGDRSLLIVDSAINLILGILLMLYPTNLAAVLGLPAASEGFYPTILGAVLFGIGLALAMEAAVPVAVGHGLGLLGAIAINLCGGLALLAWLFFGQLGLPVRGQIILWVVCVLVLSLSLAELARRPWRSRG